MTPEKRAKKLVDRFMSIKPNKPSDYSILYTPTAKQCALIAVDEMLNVIGYKSDFDYWQEVKQEIEKL